MVSKDLRSTGEIDKFYRALIFYANRRDTVAYRVLTDPSYEPPVSDNLLLEDAICGKFEDFIVQ